MRCRLLILAMLAGGLVAVSACTGGSAAPGQSPHVKVAGTLVRVGGPPPGAPVPLPGMITAVGADGRQFSATSGDDGRFDVMLPSGTYHFTGRSPLIDDGKALCTAMAAVHVQAGHPVHSVTVVCSVP